MKRGNRVWRSEEKKRSHQLLLLRSFFDSIKDRRRGERMISFFSLSEENFELWEKTVKGILEKENYGSKGWWRKVYGMKS